MLYASDKVGTSPAKSQIFLLSKILERKHMVISYEMCNDYSFAFNHAAQAHFLKGLKKRKIRHNMKSSKMYRFSSHYE